MKHSLIALAIACVLFLTASTFKQETTPDPEDYARIFLQVIKQKDRQLYVNTFALRSADIAWMANEVNGNSHINDVYRERWNRFMVGDSVQFLENMNRTLNENYDRVQDWVQKDSIDLNELQTVATYFKLYYESNLPFYICQDMLICLKYKEKFFVITINGPAYLNGRWVYGEVDYITEKKQHWEDLDEDEDFSADTTIAAVDSAAPAPTKKQIKNRKKIYEQNIKLEKLYEKAGEDY